MPKPGRSGQSGLSLVEIMIAMTVLAFVLLAFLSIMTSAASLTASTREAMLASYELQSAVEDTVAISYDNFKASYVNGPTSAGSDSNGFNLTPTPSTHPLAKYWMTAANQTQRPLLNESMWMEILTQNAVTTSYRIHVRWKTHKGFYQEDFMVMQRSSRN